MQPKHATRWVMTETGTGMGESYLDRYRGFQRGYVERDDAAIAADVRSALLSDGSIDATGLTIHALHDDVTLTGSVPSVAMRHRAVELARAVRGVALVHDALVVRDPNLH